MGHKVYRGRKVKEEKQAPWDHKGLPGAREPQEAREPQDLRERREARGLQGPRGAPVQQEAREPPEARELLEPWGPRGAREAVEQREAKERLELKAPKANPALTLTGLPGPMSRMATIISTLASLLWW